MANNKILLCLAHMSGQEMKYIQEAFDTNWVVPLGPNVNAFEEDLEQLCGEDKRVVALSSGTAAIHLALVNLGVTRGDEVICQSMTFSASANPVVYQARRRYLLIASAIPGISILICSKRQSRTVSLRLERSPKPSFLCIFTACLPGLTISWRSRGVMRYLSLRILPRPLAHVIVANCAEHLENSAS